MPCQITLHDDEEGKSVDLSFADEFLGLPAEHGFGYPMLQLRQRLGPDGRFEILRKLGWGRYASVWLAGDNKTRDSYVALKVLTGHAADLVENNVLQEVEVMERLQTTGKSHGNCLSIQAHFTIPGAIPDDGKHLCIATELCATDVEEIWKACPNRQMPIPLAKKVLRDILLGLHQLYSVGCVHTDVKPANVLWKHPDFTSPAAISSLLELSPSLVNPPEDSWCGKVQSIKSQPLSPELTLEEAIRGTFMLSDFGHAQVLDKRTVPMIATDHYRPPEVILGGPWNEDVDIWMFGCLVFEFITGKTLFNRTPQGNIHPDTYHVGLVLKYLGQAFPVELMQKCVLADELGFDVQTGNFRIPIAIDPGFIPRLLEEWLVPRGIDETDITAATKLLLRCLRLNPAERPTAAELLDSEHWLRS